MMQLDENIIIMNIIILRFVRNDKSWISGKKRFWVNLSHIDIIIYCTDNKWLEIKFKNSYKNLSRA